MKLLIVDDDDIIRLVIRNIAIEENLGFDTIEEAENGEEAIIKSMQLQPDIIITDIRMPGVDGLAFIEQTRSSLPDSKFIILSGYDDFNYAQKAIKFGVCEYLLKPYSREEMVSLLKNYISIINDEKAIKERKQNMMKFFNSNYSVLNEKQFVEMLKGTDEETSDMLGQIKMFFKTDLSGKFYAVLYIDIDRKQHVCKEIYLNDGRLMVFAVRNIVDELAKENFKYISFEDSNMGIVLILSFKGGKNDFESKLHFLAEKIKYMVNKFLKHSVTICVGNTLDSADRIKQGYREVLNITHFKLFYESNSILKCSKLIGRNKVFNIDVSTLESIVQSLLDTDDIALNFKLEKLFQEITSSYELDALSVKRAISRLLVYVYNELAKQDILIDDMYGEDISCRNTILQLETMKDLKHWLKSFLYRIIEVVRQQKKGLKSKNIVTVLRFIEENYNRDFTLEDVAEKVHLNPNYLSELFKKEVGTNFVDYVTQVRIEAAKKLLAEGTKKIGEIAREVGYTSQDYFCKVFKKMTGTSPRKYK